MKNHSLITTLKSLTGNPRGCVYTEPLWGIPFNLYAPYISIYMVAIGLSDKQIGLIVSISWSFQIVLALLSGVVTDKLGRRRTTLIFDILAWSVPALISAIAQNFWYFVIAGVINSVWQITHNSWTCLLVEDADQEQLVDIYTWIHIANQIVGFVAPLAGLLIGIFDLIPTVRGLYIFAAIMFTVKAVVTYQMTDETRQGKIRMHETRHQSMLSVLREYSGVFQHILRTPQTLFTAGIMLVISISNVVTGSFWGIIVTERLHIPAKHLALFPFVKSAVMLFFFFMIMPRLNKLHFKMPMTLGFFGFVISQLILITAPEASYLFLGMSVFLEACCFAAVNPLVDQMIALTIDPKERARIQSILYVGIILITSPFGWIAGNLSDRDKILPFILNITLFSIGSILAYMAGNAAQKRLSVEAPTV
ncbi:MAG TPA: MFS transporter [Anaerolineales bacterium]|nr:MFS transporter [Anaerolineales bacterium]